MAKECTETGEGASTSFSRAAICQAQKDDQNIGPVIDCKLSEKKPVGQQLKSFTAQSKCLLREWEKLSFDGDGVLHRKTATRTQLVIPEKQELLSPPLSQPSHSN